MSIWFVDSPSRRLSASRICVMDFAQLQKRIRSDPDGYRSEFLHQLRHYEATLEIFKARPDEPSKEFARLIRFLASVADAFPKDTKSLSNDLMELLRVNKDILHKSLRTALVQCLMQLRRRKQIELTSLCPLFFELFGCKDKSLRHLLFAFIVSDIKSTERTGGQTMRQMKGLLFNVLKSPDEMIAKKALAILTDLWRRQVWQDAHTANVIASGVHHPKTTVMYACVKFFLGYDLKEGEDEDEIDIRQEAQPTAGEIYKAQKKGTKSSKKKKLRKLKRVRSALMRQAKKEHAPLKEPFAAIQLLQDPYGIAETLFSRARTNKLTSQTRLGIIKLMSRIISVHRLVMLNFYPYLQKYLFPKGRDILVILAALVEGCHEMIPPDALLPVMRQLVDGFVHDHARPEVITLGLKTVREMCSRAPLVMDEALLSDLVLYKKFKDSEVRAAAKGLITTFRERAPHLLPKKERGRGIDADHRPRTFGEQHAYDRIEGAAMLQKEKEGSPSLDADSVSESKSESGDEGEDEGDEMASTDDDKDWDVLSEDSEDDGKDVTEGTEAACIPDQDPVDDALMSDRRRNETNQLRSDGTSLAALRKRLATLKQRKAQRVVLENEDGQQTFSSFGRGHDGSKPLDDLNERRIHLASENASVPDRPRSKDDREMPIEMKEILNDEDFERLRDINRDLAIQKQLRRFGIRSDVSVGDRLMQAAEADADGYLDRQHHQTHHNEASIDPQTLAGKKRIKADKEERMQSILKGRDDMPYQSRARNKKQKTGGLSNKEKIKRKSLPLKGRIAQAKKRRKRSALKRKQKNFKGHV